MCHLHVGPQGGDSVPHDVQRPVPLGRLIASPRGEGGGLHLSTTGIEQPEKNPHNLYMNKALLALNSLRKKA